MWKIVFEESMLATNKDLIIHCPSKYLAEDLMEVLERNGVMWCSDDLPTSDTRWGQNAEDTCYWVKSKKLFCGEKQYADEDPYGEYKEYIRCTFYRIEAPNFDVASKNEILSLFGV